MLKCIKMVFSLLYAGLKCIKMVFSLLYTGLKCIKMVFSLLYLSFPISLFTKVCIQSMIVCVLNQSSAGSVRIIACRTV